MIDTTPTPTIRELDRRVSDGIDVTLLWNSATDQVVLAMHDSRTGDWFEVDVPAADALDAFHHPYAYAAAIATAHLLAA